MNDIVVLCVLAAIFVVHGQVTTPPFSWDGHQSNNNTNSTGDDDPCFGQASCGCCLMRRQMDVMGRFFNHTMNNLHANLNRVKNALNNIRAASRSVFSVALTNERWFCLGPEPDVVPVVYKHVFLDAGDDYSPETGVFTAPRAGVYSMAVTAYSDDALSAPACASLRINGQVATHISRTNQQDQEDSSTTVLAMQLNAGDRVSVILPIGCKLCDSNSHFNTFSGFLLYSTD